MRYAHMAVAPYIVAREYVAVALDVDHVAVQRTSGLAEVDRGQFERRNHSLHLIELDSVGGVLRPGCMRAIGVSGFRGTQPVGLCR